MNKFCNILKINVDTQIKYLNEDVNEIFIYLLYLVLVSFI
jgi:hypothetical protein